MRGKVAKILGLLAFVVVALLSTPLRSFDRKSKAAEIVLHCKTLCAAMCVGVDEVEGRGCPNDLFLMCIASCYVKGGAK